MPTKSRDAAGESKTRAAWDGIRWIMDDKNTSMKRMNLKWSARANSVSTAKKIFTCRVRHVTTTNMDTGNNKRLE
jgi:hypothetical protein